MDSSNTVLSVSPPSIVAPLVDGGIINGARDSSSGVGDGSPVTNLSSPPAISQQIFSVHCGSCIRPNCVACTTINHTSTFIGLYKDKVYNVTSYLDENVNCRTSNVVYLITCTDCGLKYVGETSRTFATRLNEHRRFINKHQSSSKLLYDHFNGDSTCKEFYAHIIEALPVTNSPDHDRNFRQNRETFWIKTLRTKFPYGLNDKLPGYKADCSTFHSFSRKPNKKRGSRVPRSKQTKSLDYNQLARNILHLYGTNPHLARNLLFKTLMTLPKRILAGFQLHLETSDSFSNHEYLYDVCNDI